MAKGGKGNGGTNHQPSQKDSSMTIKGGSVNDGAVRTKPASTPKSLGPRTA